MHLLASAATRTQSSRTLSVVVSRFYFSTYNLTYFTNQPKNVNPLVAIFFEKWVNAQSHVLAVAS